jgi:hypothetical protein
MPAEAGIQGRAGMDTGFRRYDGTFVPIRRSDHTYTCIFEGEHEGHEDKTRKYFRTLRALRVDRGEYRLC